MAAKIFNCAEIDKILLFMKSECKVIKRIGVTGSYAQKKQTEESDLDIVVDVDKNDRNSFWPFAQKLREVLINNYMLPVDFVFYDDAVNRAKYKEDAALLDKIESDMYREMLLKTRWMDG